MPKYGIHQIVLEKAAEKLADGVNPVNSRIASDINSNKGLAMLGAVGPDLFFWAPDYPQVDKFYNLYKNFEKLIDIYNTVVAPVRAVTGAVGTVSEKAVKTLAPRTVELIELSVEEIKETGKLFRAAVSTGIMKGVLDVGDLFTEMASLPSLSETFFSLFIPEMQKQLYGGKTLDEKDWYWFEMLHYRRVGKFNKELFNLASNNPSLRAYAYGYFSHVATDVVGHAYVNQLVGAPYRLHVQRHVTVENFMDAWAFNHYHLGSNVSQSLLNKLSLPDPAEIDISLIDLIDGAFRNTYDDLFPTKLGNPGYLSKLQIFETYKIFHGVLTIMEKMSISRPEEPFSGALDILSEAFEDLFEAPPTPPSLPNAEACGAEIFGWPFTKESRDCYEEFFKQASVWFEYIGEVMLWSMETFFDLIDLILATLLFLPINVLLASLYAAQLVLYDVYKWLRYSLSELGFIYPDPEDLNNSLGQSLITTAMSCSPPFHYPTIYNGGLSHLVCAVRRTDGYLENEETTRSIAGNFNFTVAQTDIRNLLIEKPPTLADFHINSESINPSSFIELTPFSSSILSSYARSSSPSDTRDLEKNDQKIGNAIDFSAFMMATATENNDTALVSDIFTDWNLDSDRGYGYKSWDGKFDIATTTLTAEGFDT